MKINDFIYEKLTEEDLALIEDYHCKTRGIHDAGLIYSYSSFVRLNEELFPNNYLDELALRDRKTLGELCNNFLNLLDNPETGEREILNFVRDNNAYHLIVLFICTYTL